MLPWPGRRRASDPDARQVSRRPRKRSAIQRWFPTAVFGTLVGGMVLLFGALRIMAQPAEPAEAPPPPVIEIVEQPEVAVAAAVAQRPEQPAPGEIVTQVNGVTFRVRQVEPTYTVAPGDSLSSIAQRHGTTAEAIQGINNLSDTFLRVNQRLVLP